MHRITHKKCILIGFLMKNVQRELAILDKTPNLFIKLLVRTCAADQSPALNGICNGRSLKILKLKPLTLDIFIE